MKFNLYTISIKIFTYALTHYDFPSQACCYVRISFVFNTLKMSEEQIETLLELNEGLKLRIEELERDAEMTRLDMTHMRHEISDLKQTLTAFMTMMSGGSSSAIATSAPSNAAAMAGGGATSAQADPSSADKTETKTVVKTVAKTDAKKPCIFFAQGTCSKGEACSFAHVSIKKPCTFFAKGACTKGDSCSFSH